MSGSTQPRFSLPAFGALTDVRRWGMACVHCGHRFTPADAGTGFDYGDQFHETPCGSRVRWFPRACTDCHAKPDAHHRPLCGPKPKP